MSNRHKISMIDQDLPVQTRYNHGEFAKVFGLHCHTCSKRTFGLVVKALIVSFDFQDVLSNTK